MKQNVRKFLSLLMVFAMLCSMIPAAFAASVPSYIDYEEDEYGDYELELDFDDNLYSDGSYDMDDNDTWVEVSVTVWDGNEDITDDCYIYYNWSGDYDDYEDEDDYSYAYLDTSDDSCYVKCKISVKYGKSYILEGWVDWDLEADGTSSYDGDIVVEATVYNTSEEYYLDEKDDEGNASIEDQLFDAIADLSSKYNYEFEYLKFTSSSLSVTNKGSLDAYKNTKYYFSDCYYKYDNSDYLLEEVYFEPDEDFEGEVAFDFTAYYFVDYDNDYSYDQNDMDSVDGTMVFNVTAEGAGTGIGILVTAEDGENVELDEDLFVDFWEETYSKGELDYVKFNSVSTGALYDNYTSSKKPGTDVEGEKCYYEPTSKQIGLDDLTYVPGKNTTSATISFTASGTNNSKRTTTLSGKITVLYMDGDIDPIEYELEEDKTVTLDADDFTANYKSAMGVKTAGTLQIMFLEVPENGDLYMNYSVNSKTGKVSGTKLTASNITGYQFSTSTKATRSIEDVTYVPDSDYEGDEITFACYSSNQLKYVGTISFEGAALEPVVVQLSCTTIGGTFSVKDFFSVNNANMLYADYITFGTPSSGTLYKNYGTANSSKVTAYDKFGAVSSGTVNAISSVAFIPSKTGTVEIPFTAPLTTGRTLTGTVKITVTAAFNDVSSSAYYYNAVQWAVNNNVTTGTTANTFSPNKTCTRAEVVTFLWRSKGSPEPKTTSNPFVDISASDPATGYAYKAVLWAVEQGITTGIDATHFDPTGTCTSGQVVTFLYRANGQPYGATTGVDYLTKPVQWANSKSLLTGTDTPFSANNYATRAEIVTYMYRAAN